MSTVIRENQLIIRENQMANITGIYKLYGIPEVLQMHMFRVAAIADQILSVWHGPNIDRESLMRVLLLHDMGNIVKMDIEPSEDSKTRAVREKYLSKFGKDDHRVSHEIAKELGLSNNELSLMDGKIFIKNDKTLLSNDYSRKIGAYADQRAAPDGVFPLLTRLREAQRRYSDKPGSSMNNPRTEKLIECALEIEKQLMVYCDLDPSDITNTSVAYFIDHLHTFEVRIK